MITADEMKKLAFKKKEELSEENINIEKINNVILDKAEKGKLVLNFIWIQVMKHIILWLTFYMNQ